VQDITTNIQSEKLLKSFELLKKRQFQEAELLLQQGFSEAEKAGDKILMALFCSGMGVLFKLQKEFRKAWKQYEKAEKLLPDDASLKIISSRLLVDYFGQYDIVIKKMNKVLELSDSFSPFKYQAHTIIGLAYLRKGSKKEAVESLKKSMLYLNESLDSVANVDFELVEGLSRKKIEPEICLEFLEKARNLAQLFKEEPMKKFIQKLIDTYPKAPVSGD